MPFSNDEQETLMLRTTAQTESIFYLAQLQIQLVLDYVSDIGKNNVTCKTLKLTKRLSVYHILETNIKDKKNNRYTKRKKRRMKLASDFITASNLLKNITKQSIQ